VNQARDNAYTKETFIHRKVIGVTARVGSSEIG
jgi:hypothetical protein